MPRRLEFVNLGGFVEPIEIVDRDLEAVVAMLGALTPERIQKARQQIEILLEDYVTAQSQTVKAKTIPEDLEDLKSLAKLTEPEWMTERLRDAANALEDLRANNPVLHRRLQWLLRHQRIQEQVRALTDREELIFAFGRGLSMHIETLKDQVTEEDGRGHPQDDAAFRLGNGLYQVWMDFTERGTSRQNAPERQRDPFGDFVEAVGRLVNPEFKGHHLARKVHDARRASLSGGN